MFFTIISTTAVTAISLVTAIGVAMWFEAKPQVRRDIERLLEQCRETEQWDERSELKLSQWLLGTNEEELYKCGLIKLHKIRRSISEYLYVHLYGRDPVPPTGVLESALQNWADRLRERRNNRIR